MLSAYLTVQLCPTRHRATDVEDEDEKLVPGDLVRGEPVDEVAAQHLDLVPPLLHRVLHPDSLLHDVGVLAPLWSLSRAPSCDSCYWG